MLIEPTEVWINDRLSRDVTGVKVDIPADDLVTVDICRAGQWETHLLEAFECKQARDDIKGTVFLRVIIECGGRIGQGHA